jgi:hypothetical protein
MLGIAPHASGSIDPCWQRRPVKPTTLQSTELRPLSLMSLSFSLRSQISQVKRPSHYVRLADAHPLAIPRLCRKKHTYRTITRDGYTCHNNNSDQHLQARRGKDKAWREASFNQNPTSLHLKPQRTNQRSRLKSETRDVPTTIGLLQWHSPKSYRTHRSGPGCVSDVNCLLFDSRVESRWLLSTAQQTRNLFNASQTEVTRWHPTLVLLLRLFY